MEDISMGVEYADGSGKWATTDPFTGKLVEINNKQDDADHAMRLYLKLIAGEPDKQQKDKDK